MYHHVFWVPPPLQWSTINQTGCCCAIVRVHSIYRVQCVCMCRCLLKSSGFKVDSLHFLQFQMAPALKSTNMCFLVPPSHHCKCSLNSLLILNIFHTPHNHYFDYHHCTLIFSHCHHLESIINGKSNITIPYCP